MTSRKKKLRVGLFGFGTVGRGLYDLLKAIPSQQVEIARVCVRDLSKNRHVTDVEFTDNPDDIFDDDRINFIVELIDDAEASWHIVRRALEHRLPVVSGNKKMLARHLPELIELQQRTGTALLYDASACGSIPVIRNLEEYYDNDLLISVKGILNGSSNFILSKIFNEGMPHGDALTLARKLGFLESDPTLDLDGWDSLYKLVILTVHAFGAYVEPERVFTFGITRMNDADIRFAREKDRRIKLVGHVEKLPDGRLMMSVMPHLLSRQKYIYSVEDEFNGVVIKGAFYYKQFMFGQGAGAKPTSSAVMSDITACLYDYRYEYKKLHGQTVPRFTNDCSLRVYMRYSDERQIERIGFEEITESYRSIDQRYVVGRVSLANLHANMDFIRSEGLFVMAYPES